MPTAEKASKGLPPRRAQILSLRTYDGKHWGPSSALVMAVFGCLTLSVGAQWLLHGIYQFVITDWTKVYPYDAAVDWAAARLFWKGISPYSAEGLTAVGVPAFGHPPTTSFWLLPLAQFDLPTMAHMIGLLNLGLLLALVGLVIFALRVPMPYVTTLALFGLIQDSPATFDHNKIVQFSVVIAFGTVLAWVWLRAGKDLRAGVALGLVCTLKPFPGVILILLLLMRRLRAVAAAAVSFLLVAGVMTWRYGFEAWPLFLEQQKPIAAYWMGDVRNASLQGVLRRLLRERCGISVMDPELVNVITLGACLLLLGLCTLITVRALRLSRDKVTFDRAYALFCALSAFLNPWIWQHYVFILVMPVLVSIHALAGYCITAWKDWSSATLSHLGQVRVTALTGVGLLPLLAIPRWSQFTLQMNGRATLHYCQFHGSPEVKTWLSQQARYIEITSWLPWAFCISVLTILLFLPQVRHRPRLGSPTLVSSERDAK
jgi:hypothetical protein